MEYEGCRRGEERPSFLERPRGITVRLIYGAFGLLGVLMFGILTLNIVRVMGTGLAKELSVPLVVIGLVFFGGGLFLSALALAPNGKVRLLSVLRGIMIITILIGILVLLPTTPTKLPPSS